jgi:hypothetical protein
MCWPIVKFKRVVPAFLVWIVKCFFWGLSLISGITVMDDPIYDDPIYGSLADIGKV